MYWIDQVLGGRGPYLVLPHLSGGTREDGIRRPSLMWDGTLLVNGTLSSRSTR